jgi:lipoate-protein ligase A
MSTSWYEIICNGCKIIGSAQRRWKDGMLQQGSLLFDFDPVVYYKLFRFPDQARRDHMIAESRNRIGGLNGLLPTRVNPKSVSDQIASGFEKAMGIQLKPAGLTAFELERAHQLTRIKYSNPTWNQNR